MVGVGGAPGGGGAKKWVSFIFKYLNKVWSSTQKNLFSKIDQSQCENVKPIMSTDVKPASQNKLKLSRERLNIYITNVRFR